LFLWAEAIATTCFTQNRSIIHRRFNKTPYELINGRKPDISFLYVFGALCYPKNGREEIGKLGAKGYPDLFVVRRLRKNQKSISSTKASSNSRQRLHLLHMDLYGPMRIASINGKLYILVIVDDYSCYTWVHFLRSKDEAPEVIIKFLKRITVLLQSPVIIIRTDNDTEFKNQVLKVYFDSVGISHQMSSVRTPQQNIVVERRNRTLVEAARTMKLGAKGDIGFFIGYSADSCAYRIYNRPTKKIIETMNVSFDELSAMVFKQRSSKPGLQCMTSGQIGSGLDLTYAPSTIMTQQPTEGELDLLFEAMYDDYFGGQPSANVENVPPAQEPQVRQPSTASTTIADNVPIPTNLSSHATNILITSQDVASLIKMLWSMAIRLSIRLQSHPQVLLKHHHLCKMWIHRTCIRFINHTLTNFNGLRITLWNKIYNRRTKKIMETINDSFDELSVMAFEQRSSKPGLNSITSGHISLGLDLTYAPSTITTQQPSEGLDLTYAPSTITKQQPNKGELDLLFEALYDDYFGGQPSATVENVPPAQEPQVRQTSTASTTSADNVPIPTNSSSHATNIPITSQDVDELNSNFMVDGNTFVNPFVTSSSNAAETSSSQNVDPSNMHTFYQPYPHELQCTKDHPQMDVKTAFLYDADYVGCKDSFKSTSSGAQFLGEKL
nr:ribonuclease H-like domain-containing protein [Tanacetum cinerariifolium]